MSLGAVFEQGLGGIRQGLAGLERSAQTIASGSFGEPVRASGNSVTPSASAAPPVDEPAGTADGLAEAIVRLERQARDVQAAAKVVDTADAVLGRLLGYQDG